MALCLVFVTPLLAFEAPPLSILGPLPDLYDSTVGRHRPTTMTIVIENQYIPLFPVIVEAGEFCLAAGWGSVGMAVGAVAGVLLLIMRRLATDEGLADDLGRLVS